MIAGAGLALAAAVLPVCASPSVMLARFRAALGMPWRHPFELRGANLDQHYAARISAHDVRLTAWDNVFVEEWHDGARASTHTFQNGFIGVAAPWRRELRLAADEALTGMIATRPLRAGVCRRAHRRSYVELTFRSGSGTAVKVSVDPRTGLPARAVATSDVGFFALSQIKYAHIDGSMVPVEWSDGDNRYVFRAAVAPVAAVAPSPPPPPPSISTAARMVLVRNPRKPASRGISARVNGKRAVLMLDTGNTLTVVGASLAKRLGLRPIARRYVDAAGGIARVPIARVRTLDVGPVHVKNEFVAVLPQTYGYDGAIGLALFARASASFRGDVISLAPHAGQRPGYAVTRHVRPLDTFDGVPVVDGSIAGERTPLVLDSGAPLGALFPDRVRSAGTKVAGSTECTMLGSSVWLSPMMYRYRDVRVGDAPKSSLDACVVRLDDLARGLHFPLLGFRGMFGPIRSLDYASARAAAFDRPESGPPKTDAWLIASKPTRDLESVRW